MKFSSETKVGVIGIATIAILIWGLNYLKGRNIFNTTYTLYAFYQESGGMESSSPVLINGVKIGYVEKVVLRTDETPAIKVILNIEKRYRIGEGSVAELISADLLGSKAIRIANSKRQIEVQDHDTLQSVIEPDIISSMQERIFPVLEKTEQLALSLDTLSRQMGKAFSGNAISQSLDNIADLTYSLKTSLSSGGSLDKSFSNLESFTTVLEEEKEEMSSLLRNLNSISASLNRAGIDSLSAGMTSVLLQFNRMMEQINTGKGSAGKLIYSDTLHENFLVLVNDLDSLVRDLKENPEDYVQISLFGNSKN